jgi:hypothetical protein
MDRFNALEEVQPIQNLIVSFFSYFQIMFNNEVGLLISQDLPMNEAETKRLKLISLWEFISGAPLWQTPALLTNIRLRWKGLPGTNTLANYKQE